MYNVTVFTAFAGNIELRSYAGDSSAFFAWQKEVCCEKDIYIIMEELVYHQCLCLDQICTGSLAVPFHLQSDFENLTVKLG